MATNLKFAAAMAALVFAGTAVAEVPLPAGYTRLDWIQSFGGQWIDTKVTGKATSVLTMDFVFLRCRKDSKESYDEFLGAKMELAPSSSYLSFNVFRNYAENFASGLNNGIHFDCVDSQCAPVAGMRYVLEVDAPGSAVTGWSVDASGTRARRFRSERKTAPAGETLGTLLLCNARRNGVPLSPGRASHLRLFSAKIAEAGVPVRAFVPCRSAAGEAGLWDTVKGEFYGNASGVGRFCGSDDTDAVIQAAVRAADATPEAVAKTKWEIGEPIVTYWAGPGFHSSGDPQSDFWLEQLKACGINLVWAWTPEEVKLAEKHGMRVLYSFQTAEGQDVEARVNAVKDSPSLYLYNHRDEPGVSAFARYAAERDFVEAFDPDHPTWVNLLPTYANRGALGSGGPVDEAYRQYVERFCRTYRPAILSYDHYQMNNGGDTKEYLLNLEIFREVADRFGIPFVNGVQASTWKPGNRGSWAPRIPGPDEIRYLVYTTAAYGADGIYYFVYYHKGFGGAIAEPDGKTGDKYEALKTLNREFVAISKELRPLAFKGAYLQGVQAAGAKPYGPEAILRLESETPSGPADPKQQFSDTTLVTRFEAPGRPTHFMVVNMDYRKSRVVTATAPTALERFDALKGKWSDAGGSTVRLALPRGGGVLLRLKDSGNERAMNNA